MTASDILAAVPWQWAKVLPSLSGSGKPYIGCCLRPINGDAVRVHIPPSVELQFHITKTLLHWLQQVPRTHPSFTGTKYIPAYMRIEGDKIRIQVKGDQDTGFVNRKWGVEFEHTDHAAIIAIKNYLAMGITDKPTPVIMSAPKPTPFVFGGIPKPKSLSIVDWGDVPKYKVPPPPIESLKPEPTPSALPAHPLVGKKIKLITTPDDCKGGFGPKQGMTGTVVSVQGHQLGVLFDYLTTGQNQIPGAKGLNGWFVSSTDCEITTSGPKTIAAQQAEKVIADAVAKQISHNEWWMEEKAP